MKSSKLPGMLSVKSKKGLDYMDMILKTTDLCKNFKGQMAVNNVSLNIRRNSVYGLLGPNGAGKSTILKMLTGILRPTSGSIEFDGHPWKRNDLEHIGALIEMPPLYENLTAYENLKVRTTLLGLDDARINEVLQIVQLTNTGKKRAGQFSLGMKQRLGIAILGYRTSRAFQKRKRKQAYPSFQKRIFYILLSSRTAFPCVPHFPYFPL